MAKRSKDAEATPANVNPDDIITCYTEYTGLRADGARIQQRIATMFGRFEKQGVDSKAIKRAYSEAQKDPEVAAAQRAKDAEYLRLLEIVEIDAEGQGGFGNALDKTVTHLKPSMEAHARLAAAKAGMDGFNTGMAGGDLDANRHDPGTELHVKWVEGFHDGRTALLEKNPDADKVTVAQPRRGPGRPRKNPAPPPNGSGDGIGATSGNA